MPGTKPTYRIAGWDRNFETAESRRIRRLTWVATPNKHEGRGFRRISRLENAVEVFCAFQLMIEVASKMPTRGILADEEGALDAEDLADKTGFPAEIFAAAFVALVEPRIAWLEVTP
jgi:hypothetical protein